ncbi:hypothetical protein RhiirA4_491438 [Rhizophagus irregularis]|uniref:Uncharacterized protein n=1 Tax=Rhizophagus irregularis TaxID=588596 RepID=A0A2I1HWE6_9GLOM|nr:hypothetical protein RhiirA4_491438 [Rhizophagus irregularis]
MDKVEQLAKSLAINIVEDSTQISKSKSDRQATLILSEGHYSLALNPGRLHPSKLDRKHNLPIVYQEDGVKNVVTIYNGKTVKSCTIGQFQKGKNSKSSFIPVEKNRKTGRAGCLPTGDKEVRSRNRLILSQLVIQENRSLVI